MTARRCLLAIAAAPLLAAAAPLAIRPTAQIILPPAAQTDLASAREFKPGDIILRQEISIIPKVELAQPLVVADDRLAIALPNGTPLVTVTMAGGPVEALPGLNLTVCAKVSRRDELSASDLADSTKLVPFATGDDERLSQYFCMIDSDGDNLLDHFLSLNAKGKPSPKAMPPVGVSIQPSNITDVVREILIRYEGIGNVSNKLTFRALMSINGKLVGLLESLARIRKDPFPQPLTLLGAKCTVRYIPAEFAADRRVAVRLEAPIPLSQPVIADPGPPTVFYYMP
jgi:hypothetical protein